jgi:ribose 5-phosphate isomerase A
VIADYLGEVDDADRTGLRLSSTTGVIEHGLFPPTLVSEILVARGGQVDRIKIPARASAPALRQP